MAPPLFGRSPPDYHSLGKNHPKNTTIDTNLNSVLTHLTLHPRIWLSLSTLFIIIVVLSYPPPIPSLLSMDIDRSSVPSHCPSGTIYVYDLPSVFNQDLVDSCNESDPWHWRCKAVSNEGFGPISTELKGIVPDDVLPAWYWTNQFSAEILFHHRLLNYRCRTMEPESATAFYMPFYAGLSVGRYLWENRTMRDHDSETMLKWVQDRPYWKRSNGSDHFLVIGRITWDFRRMDSPDADWGSSFFNMPAMRNVTRLIVERAPNEEYEIGLPYPTGFHPRSESDITIWQQFVRTRRREKLFSFVGASRADQKADFRTILMSQCRNESDSCRLIDCNKAECAYGKTKNLETFMESEFCLQPKGDSDTRRSVFDCMLSGSIPVFFWDRTAYRQYQWFLPSNRSSYSVYIEEDDVRNGLSVKRVLEKYSKIEVEKMREKVIEYIPNFLYAKPRLGLNRTSDAFDIAVNGILNRIREKREQSESNV
ncbi:xyloglucan galactosyltransferase XLT2-like [Impatiens glandulifera]|uniref:xyloglucan galactosyltransferase XLT2-like n=1 Tax=Impatiens glandulifera TaxID=253017 RepID=UPI001FB0B7C7|nr:xyloglucan galactosyltransferase XLT2-like [Impatiens glandulifera]